MLLFNETLESLDFSYNKLSKMGKIIQNLVRNNNSSLLKLDLSHNKLEIEDFTILLNTLNG